MPPDGKPQLTPLEISTIEAWISSGADFEKKLNQFADGDSLKFIVASFAASKAEEPVEEKSYAFSSVSPDVVEKLNTPVRSVFPLHQNSPALQVDFFLRESFKPEFLEELKSIGEQLVILNLSKMPVNDLAVVATFNNLEILNLNFTAIDGAALTSLRGLQNLQSLSLAGTSIGANDLEKVLALPKLAEIYVWNTQITDKEREVLSKKFPDVEIIGNLFSEAEILRLDRPRLENDGVLRKGELISLKHSMPGVAIRMTRDGSGPDSTNSDLYDKPFPISESMILKAKACKDGWYCSDVFSVSCFVEGIAPVQVELQSPADKQYPGTGAAGLTDLQKGFADILKEPSWLGYREGPFSAIFDVGKGTALKRVVISHGQNIGGFVFPPAEVQVWAGENKDNMKLVHKFNPVQPKGYTPNGVLPVTIPLELKDQFRYYRIVASPVPKLPSWHKSKGERGWLFVDEVFFY
jgi:Leucine-rich repeat (LRR) protein